MTMELARRLVLEPGEGEAVWLGGVGVVFKARGEDTGGAFAVVEHPIRPGALVPPHRHEREDELTYVLEGEVGIRVGEREATLGPGTYLWKPRGVPHAFWNATDVDARIMEVIAPAGFERFFSELADLLAQEPRDERAIEELGRRFGHVFHEGWTEDLRARYGVEVR